MTQQEKDGLLSTVLNIPTPLKVVQYKPKNWLQRILIFSRIRKVKSEMLYIRNTKMSVNWRLTALANALNNTQRPQDVHEGMQSLHENSYQMAAYLAAAIHNKNEETPKYLIETIFDSFSNQELEVAIKEVHRRLDVPSFFVSMELAGSLSLM